MVSAVHNITILGSTGSIGMSTLSVIRDNPNYKVFALSARQNVEGLLAQCLEFSPRFAVMANPQAAQRFASALSASDCTTELLRDEDALQQIASAPEVDSVMAAIVGGAGLEPTFAAVHAGKRLLLANKESLVMSGDLLMQAAAQSGAVVLPIDSEHNAIFQCLPDDPARPGASDMRQVEKVILTASGGPFLHTALEEFATITPAQACKHPKWDMGRKISVDSATMMNKGLEFIEACILFDLEPAQVEVLIHPQSIVHSMVYYRDGSVLAQLGNPDMRIPIASGLAWPERMESGAATLDLTAQSALEFIHPDLERFPCLQLGIEAAQEKGTAATILNAANEVAVEAFLADKVGFTQIPEIIKAVRSQIPCEAASSLAIIRDTDTLARSVSKELILKDFC